MIEDYAEKFIAASKFQAENDELATAKITVATFCAEICAYNELKRQRVRTSLAPRWLTLSGKSGCGKTMLAKEAFAFLKANAAIREVGRAEIVKFGEVVGYDEIEVRNNLLFYESGELQETLYAPTWRNKEAEEAFFVGIDDLGAGHNSEFAVVKLGELFNRRMGKWTLFTTNLTQRDVSELLDTRIASRLTRDGNAIMKIQAEDYCKNKLKGTK